MTEYEQAKAWRYRSKLTLDQLSELTGYSREALFLFERGRNSANKPHAAHAWRRYKLACLAARFMLHYGVKSVDSWSWD